ncbi:MAG: hypothetical protein WAO52_09275 [Prolixibacteraceae bacterium]
MKYHLLHFYRNISSFDGIKLCRKSGNHPIGPFKEARGSAIITNDMDSQT